MLSRAPSDAWVIDYLERDRGVHVLWIEAGVLKGPALGRLFESGSAARRRDLDYGHESE